MEEIRVFFIVTPWRQAHKWAVGDDGLIEYRDERITPREASERFPTDYPMFSVLRAEVCLRVANPDGPRAYRWIEEERFI